MDKSRLLAHTKEYLDKLSNGVDPLTNGSLSADSILKKERVSKCLSYCAGVFGRCLDDGGVSENHLYVYKLPEYKNEEAAITVAGGFLEKLSKGEDPLGGSVAPGDLVKNQRISRCFGYAAQQLRLVIVRKRPFDISEDALDGFDFSDEPLKISEIKQRADALVDLDCMNGLKADWITKYLVSIQLLEEKQSSDGKNRRMPTLMGRQLGITQDIKEFGAHSSSAVLYSRKMQELIVRNIPMILEKYRNAENGAYLQRE